MSIVNLCACIIPKELSFAILIQHLSDKRSMHQILPSKLPVSRIRFARFCRKGRNSPEPENSPLIAKEVQKLSAFTLLREQIGCWPAMPILLQFKVNYRIYS